MTAQKLILPIGQSLGVRHEDVPDGGHVNEVRRGADVLELTDPELTVWTLAHGGTAPEEPYTVDRLRADAAAGGVLAASDVDSIVETLRGKGMLAEVAVGADADEAEAFARAHRLLPLALGLGRQADAPDMVGVGLLYRPLALLSPALADLWQFAPMTPNLWSGCVDSVAVAEAAGAGNPAELDPATVLAAVLESMHLMLAARVAGLDVTVGSQA